MILYLFTQSITDENNREKVGAPIKYVEQPKQMNVRFIGEESKEQIKKLEKEIIKNSRYKVKTTTMRTIEQIDAELEVLRNELTILKAEAQTPKKKPIEFVKYLSSIKMEILNAEWEPKDFVSFKKLEMANDFMYDIIKATDENGLELVFLGHWNDGIK